MYTCTRVCVCMCVRDLLLRSWKPNRKYKDALIINPTLAFRLQQNKNTQFRERNDLSFRKSRREKHSKCVICSKYLGTGGPRVHQINPPAFVVWSLLLQGWKPLSIAPHLPSPFLCKEPHQKTQAQRESQLFMRHVGCLVRAKCILLAGARTQGEYNCTTGPGGNWEAF